MTIQSDLSVLELPIQEAVLLLEPEDFESAVQMSRQATTEAWQWQLYLTTLAAQSFEHWLRDRISLPIAVNQSTPDYATILATISPIQVGDWQLCLIVTESIRDEWVTVPRAVLELPEFAAHLYILLEVQEELEQVIVRGCLRYDQWQRHQQPVSPEANWTYQLPLDWFDPTSNHLLFYLRFLEPRSIPLPLASGSVRSRIRSVQAALEEKLPQLQPENLWQQLTWEEGAALLTCPPLLDLLLRLPPQPQVTLTQQLGTVLQQLAGRSINIWNWFQQRIDGWEASWSLPQQLIPATAMRHTVGKIEAAIADLIQYHGVPIPPNAHYAVKSLEHSMQIGVVAWLVEDTEQPRWALLVILTAEPGSTLPLGTRLRIATTTPLIEVVLEREDVYLYTPVEGSLREEFVVTIVPPNGLPLTLPAFSCGMSED